MALVGVGGIGVFVEAKVGFGVNVDGIGINVAVVIDVAVTVGPKLWLSPQLESKRLANRRQTVIDCSFIFIVLLWYHGRAQRLQK